MPFITISAPWVCGTCGAPMNFTKTDRPRWIKCSNKACKEYPNSYKEPQFEAVKP